MDMTSFEETRLTSEQIGKGAKYLKEGMEVSVIFHNGKVLEVELPISITLKVTQTDPGVKGDTASRGHETSYSRNRCSSYGSSIYFCGRND